MFSFVGNAKEDICQQSSVSLITNLPSFKPTSIAGHVARIEFVINLWKSFVGQAKAQAKFRRPMRTWEVNIKMYLKEVVREDVG
jgi:hypothetical protein